MVTPLLCSWSAVWAIAATAAFKRLFGRSAVDPLYIAQRVYELRLFRGIGEYESFPSGTTAIAAAILGVLWIRAPRWRAAYVSIVACIAVALIITHNHWVSDIVAGAFLGGSIGWMSVLLGRLPTRRTTG
jgi:membrane-associated phospholipid phosphatase